MIKMLNMKMKKAEMTAKLEELKIPYQEKMTKEELIQAYNDCAPEAAFEAATELALNSSAVAEIEETIEYQEIPVEEENEASMAKDFKEFCILDMELFTDQFNENSFRVHGLKKTVFVQIDPEKNHAYVFTILNKKLSDDQEANKRAARNILTLKSLKALKSYTITQTK
jgi:hypothetical protein